MDVSVVVLHLDLVILVEGFQLSYSSLQRVDFTLSILPLLLLVSVNLFVKQLNFVLKLAYRILVIPIFGVNSIDCLLEVSYLMGQALFIPRQLSFCFPEALFEIMNFFICASQLLFKFADLLILSFELLLEVCQFPRFGAQFFL